MRAERLQLMSMSLALVASVAAGIAVARSPFGSGATVASLAGIAAMELAVVVVLARSRAARRETHTTEPLHLTLTMWGVTVAPLLILARFQSPLMSVAMVGLIALMAVSRQHTAPARYAALDASLLALVGVSMYAWGTGALRTQVTSMPALAVSALGCAYLVLLLVFWRRVDRVSITTAQAVLMLALMVFLGASVFGYFVLGLRSPGDDVRVELMPASFGFLDYRVTFPFTPSINSTPYLAAALAGTAVAMLGRRARLASIITIPALALSVLVLILSNGRGALLIAVMLGVAVFYAPALVVRFGRLVCVAAMALPLWWPLVTPALSSIFAFAQNRASFLIRNQYDDPALLGGRTRIWEPVIAFLRESDLTSLVIGHGAEGHIVTGVSEEYAEWFASSNAMAETMSVHNALLQQVLDTGLIGGAALLATLWLVTGKVQRLGTQGRTHDAMMAAAGVMAVFLSLSVAGALEETVSSGSARDLFWFFLVDAVVVASVNHGHSAPLDHRASGVAPVGAVTPDRLVERGVEKHRALTRRPR